METVCFRLFSSNYLLSAMLFVVIVVAFLPSSLSGAADRDYRVAEDCNKWKDVVKTLLTTDPAFSLSCAVNDACTGFDCTLNVTLLTLTGLRLRVELHPCSKPVQLQILGNFSSIPFNKTLDILDTPSIYYVSIPFTTMPNLIDVSGNLTIYLSPLSNSNQVTLEVNASVSGKVKGYDQQLFDKDLKLVPRTDLTMPRCGQVGQAKDITTTTSILSTFSSTTPSHDCTGHKSTGKACNVSILDCGNHEVCIGKPSVCECIDHFYWDGSKCKNVSEGCDPTPSSSNGLVVALSCLGVAIVLGVLIVVIRSHYLKRRQRYAQHELLTNQDDSQLSDDPDPPMIEA